MAISVNAAILLGAIFLDYLLGDPRWFPHPVRLMGMLIALEEKVARRLFSTPGGLRLAGGVVVIVNIAIGFVLPAMILKAVAFNAILYFAVGVCFAWTCIAARSLVGESKEVVKALDRSLEEGRSRVAWIVGRRTNALDESGVLRATVETVAENTSDGVIAPLFYLVFGIPFGFVYKFINTMDSMIGYRNERYEDFGKVAAIVDDVVNFIPARLTAGLMILLAMPSGRGKAVFIGVKEDCHKHKSPNAGFPESAIAHTFSVRLGGPTDYGDRVVDKPWLCEKGGPVTREALHGTQRLVYASELTFMAMAFIFTLFLA